MNRATCATRHRHDRLACAPPGILERSIRLVGSCESREHEDERMRRAGCRLHPVGHTMTQPRSALDRRSRTIRHQARRLDSAPRRMRCACIVIGSTHRRQRRRTCRVDCPLSRRHLRGERVGRNARRRHRRYGVGSLHPIRIVCPERIVSGPSIPDHWRVPLAGDLEPLSHRAAASKDRWPGRLDERSLVVPPAEPVLLVDESARRADLEQEANDQ